MSKLQSIGNRNFPIHFSSLYDPFLTLVSKNCIKNCIVTNKLKMSCPCVLCNIDILTQMHWSHYIGRDTNLAGS